MNSLFDNLPWKLLPDESGIWLINFKFINNTYERTNSFYESAIIDFINKSHGILYDQCIYNIKALYITLSKSCRNQSNILGGDYLGSISPTGVTPPSNQTGE